MPRFRIENILTAGQLVPLRFIQASVAASQTNAALYTYESASHVLLNIAYTMPFDGEIIAVTLDLNAAGSAGSLTVIPTINTTSVTLPTKAITTATTGMATCRRGKNKFAAGARIGCKVTTTGAWNGTTRDLMVVVWVILKVRGN
jgi:hypothetical protein